MNATNKMVLLGVSIFALAVSANVVGSAIYARTNIDIDWKKVGIGSVIGVGAALFLIKNFKK